MRPRQSIDIGAFQFQRTKKRRLSLLSSSSKPKQSQLPPRPPLRECTNLQDRPTAAHTEPAHSAKPSTPKPKPTSTGPARKKTRERRLPLHTQIHDSLPIPDKIHKFVHLAIASTIEKSDPNASEQMRAKLQQDSQLIMERVDEFVKNYHSPEVQQWQSNPEKEQIDLKIAQMDQLGKACMDELDMWNNVVEISEPPVEWPKLDDSAQEEQFSEPQQLLQQSTDVLNTYILDTHHMFALAKRMHTLNRDTHCRVQAVAAALNQKVISQFGGRPSETLRPPDSLHVDPIDQSPRL
ncbi:hypothetical protein BWQ96_09820 [Gracilariopsis chorda]|uniref:Uncharacterized protein n=1 Tax=Gracilariopsis chorda TaxID=448386 RepID=A0A2V3IEJ7_9FLOR|nr:hypothetical protein BWQ96_09820 [Gracilariopsis chorda]|eukprot:PXF40471.1 hypothetical protein BWQ96_09820 [Gracilariopsis chorda]